MTLEAHVPLTVHGETIHVYIFTDYPGSEAKARGLQPFLQRMPPQHVRGALVRYPIFVIKNKPVPAPGGGTWVRGQVRARFTGREGITGVPAADLQRLILTPGKGLIGIPINRWERNLPRLKFTVLHEVGHCVDNEMSLTQLTSGRSATVADYRGMLEDRCGDGNPVARRAVEAYARYILRPGGICHETPPGEDDSACSRRMIRILRQSRAFSSVPATWRPGHVP
jgi:hypothetical protein